MDLNVNIKITLDETPALMRSFAVLSDILEHVKFTSGMAEAVQGTVTELPVEQTTAVAKAEITKEPVPKTVAVPEPTPEPVPAKGSHKKTAEPKPEPEVAKEKSVNDDLADDMVFASIVKNLCLSDSKLSAVVKEQLRALGVVRIKEVPVDKRRALLQEVESHAK